MAFKNKFTERRSGASYTRNRRQENCLFCSTLTHKSVNWKVEWEENLSLFKKQKRVKATPTLSIIERGEKRAHESRFSFSKRKSNFKLFVSTSSVCRSALLPYPKGSKSFHVLFSFAIERRQTILIFMMWRIAKRCWWFRGKKFSSKKSIKTNFSSSI